MTGETTTTTARSTTSSRSKATNGGEATLDAAQSNVQAAFQEVRGTLGDVGRQLPEVAKSSRSAANDMFRTIERGSDERVTAGVALSLGLAIGMLIGGAPRLLVALALAPVAAMGLVMADRWANATGRGTKSPTKA